MQKISYVNFNERGLKPIIDEIEKKHGMKVATVKAPNMPRREDGFSIKTAMINMESGQKLEIKIKANGSIYQVRLNGKVVPVKNSEDVEDPRNLAKAIEEMAGYLRRNASAYEKQKARRAKRVTGDTGPAVSTTVAKQLEAKKADLESLQEAAKELDEQLAAAKGALDTKKNELVALRAELDREIQRGETLRAELKELLEAA
ncbi:MAG: hypothetical protein ABIL58_23250 [Pseudomonadota bacterium]